MTKSEAKHAVRLVADAHGNDLFRLSDDDLCRLQQALVVLGPPYSAANATPWGEHALGTSYEAKLILELATAALAGKRNRFSADPQKHRADEIHELRRLDEVAILAFADRPDACNMFRMSKLELELAEAALHDDSEAFSERAKRNALGWYDAGLQMVLRLVETPL